MSPILTKKKKVIMILALQILNKQNTLTVNQSQ